MSDFATSLAAAKKAAGPKGEQKSSVVPELSGPRSRLPSWSHFMPEDRELSDMWRGRQRIETVESMLNHHQVAAIRQAIRLPAHRYLIELDPGELPEPAGDKLGADLDVPLLGAPDEQRPGRRAQRFNARRHLDRAMDALDYGHAVFEHTGRIDTDGTWRLTDLPPVPQWTISDQNSWEIDRHGRLTRLVQWGSNPPVKIPVEHLVTFTWQGRAGDPRGRSLLRPLTGAWTMADRTMRVMGMSAERTGMGIPVGKVSPGAVAGAKEQMSALLAGLAAGHDTNIVLDTEEDIRKAVMLMGVTGSTPDLVGMLRYYDEVMARATLAMLLQLGQTETGSRALGVTFDSLLAMFHDTVIDWYCDTMTMQLVERWVDRNYGEEYLTDGVMPRLVWSRRDDDEDEPEPQTEPQAPDDDDAAVPPPVAARRRRAVGTAASARRALRTRQAAMASSSGDRCALAGEGIASEPGSGASRANGSLPSAHAPSPAARALRASFATTGNTGVMVALYPPPATAEALALDGGEPADELHLTLAFLGKADDLASPDALHAAVRVWASSTAAITGEVSGVGLFTAGESPVTYLSLDAPTLPAARQALVDALAAAGLTISEQHGFTPHMTLDYADRVADVDAGGEMLTFTAASVVIGDERVDYRLGTAEPVSAALERRQRAMRASFATATGRDLRRDPYEHELAAHVDLELIEAQYLAARAAITAELARIRDELAARAVEEVAATSTIDPLTIGATLATLMDAKADDIDTAALMALLVAFVDTGTGQVIGEAAAQGVSIELDDSGYQDRAVADARDLVRRMARQVADSAASAARTSLPAGASGQPAANVIAEHLASLTTAQPEQAASGAASRAQNAGRAAAFEAGPEAQYFASEVLDQSTCALCLLVDGREYAALSMALDEYPSGGFIACEGGERCRGMLVAVFATDRVMLPPIAARREAPGFAAAIARYGLAARFDPNQPRDEDGRWTDSVGNVMRIALPADRERMSLPPAWTNVLVAADGHEEQDLQAIGTDGKGRTQRVYSAEHDRRQAALKFARINELHGVIGAVDAALEADDSDDIAALKLIRRTGMRPGSDADTGADKDAYGATNLRVRHVTITDGKVRLQFTGKKGVDLDLTFDDPALAALLAPRLEGKGDDDHVFATSPAKVRAALAAIIAGYKVKDLRTYRGTRLARDLVAAMDVPTTATARRKARNEVGDAVAAALGNTRAVALASYIDPAVFAPWDVGE